MKDPGESGAGGGGGGGDGGHGHGHGMSDLLLPLLVLGGFMLFFISERIVRSIAGGGGHSHGHGQAQGDDVARRKKDDDFTDKNQLGQGRSSSSQDTPRLQIGGILNLVSAASPKPLSTFFFYSSVERAQLTS